jgi:competence protein ComEC
MGGLAWRFALLGGATAGLALSPLAAVAGADIGPGLGAGALLALVGLASARARRGAVARAAWIGLVSLAAAAGGFVIGALRLAAIDGGAFHGPVGRRATVRGFVTAVPHRANGEVSVRVQTADGRLAVAAHEPVEELPIGREISAHGVLGPPEPWQAGYLARYGIREVLAANRLRLTGLRRGGAPALIDDVRDRAEAALGSGTPEAEAALLRGFVLGEDDRIDPATVDDFKRSGLAHLLAVSGENVMLLALLAMPLLALLGVPLRARLMLVLALIAIYVPVTGAGPSIQRAGVMGAAGVVAALAGRPRSRWYAVLLAAFATLALNPRASDDAGWQLSFAAVIGILLWAAGLRDVVLGSPGHTRGRATPGWRRGLAEGVGVTVSATLATAPLMAHDFGAISLASLPANLMALPAVAPLMWLGMLSGLAGQLPWVPVEPLTGVAGLLAAYVAQVAHWFGSPAWARVDVSLPGAAGVLASYVALGLVMWVVLGWARRRRGLRRPRRHRRALIAVAALAMVAVATVAVGRGTGAPGGPPPGLRVTVLDVGQGDSILLDPGDGEPVLVDGGPPGAELLSHLEREGISDLAAAVVTHDQSDHVAGIEELLGSLPIHRLIYAEPGADFLGAARAARVPTVSIAEGSEVDSGSLRLETLWPPRSLIEAPGREDPNGAALVLLARWHEFRMLLTADAEAEAVPIDPGPIDVLKVAHHGSDDAGLGRLLDRTAPRLAVVSVGADNPYGHPTPQTISALAEHHVPTLRTDEDGDVTIDVTREGWAVEAGD